MIISNVKVRVVELHVERRRLIPKGIVGAQVQISYEDPVWDTLNKTVVFRGAATKDVLDPGELVEIPWEVVETAGKYLYMGIYGTDQEGTLVIPTIWAELGWIGGAAEPSGDASTDPSLPVWAQIQSQMGSLEDLETEGRSSLVGAVNELAGRTYHGSAEPSDWNAAEGEPGHVLNRPFYTGLEIGTVLAETSPEYSESEGAFFLANEIALIAGEEYTVNWNGVEYVSHAVEFDTGNGIALILGDASLVLEEGESNGQPFAVVVYPQELAQTMFGSDSMTLMIPFDGATTLTVSIAGMVETVHKIPGEYIEQPDYAAAFYEPGHIKNRTHYKIEERIVMPATEVSVENGIAKLPVSLNLLQGASYELTMQVTGAEAVLTGAAEPYVEDGIELGMAAGLHYKNTPDTVSAIVMHVYPEYVEAIGASDMVVFPEDGDLSASMTLIIKIPEEIKRLDPEFLPVDIPAFDLEAMGLPTISLTTGDVTVTSVDTTDLLEALQKGDVTVSFLWGDNSVTVTRTVSAYKRNSGDCEFETECVGSGDVKIRFGVGNNQITAMIPFRQPVVNMVRFLTTVNGQQEPCTLRVNTEEELYLGEKPYGNLPTSGAVGQTIVVKTVDEDGRPVAWETTDLPGKRIPEYAQTEAEAAARIVNQHQSGDSIVFPFLCDAHCGYYLDTANAAVTLAGQLLALIGKRVPYDFIVHGGDLANGAWDTTAELSCAQIEDYTELMSDAHNGTPVLWVPGNHDDSPYQATADRVTQTEIFALIGRKNRLSGAICPNGCNYGYLDLENRKLRVIFLDTDDKRSWGTVAVGSGEESPAYLNAHNVSGAQLQWLADTALDLGRKENAAQWGVVVVSHVALNVSGTMIDAVSGTEYAYSTGNPAVILEAYRNGKSGSITHNGVTVSYDYSAVESRGQVICCVHGHNHNFSSETVGGCILSVGCPNVMNGRERESDDGNTYTKTAGTAEGTSFCILTIDRENSKVYADCAGVGSDREFTFTTEAMAYINQLPISSDESGEVYNGVGYKADTYLTDGVEGTKSGVYTTGFIPCVAGDKLYCQNIGMKTGEDSHRLCNYDANKTLISTMKTSTSGNAAWFTYGEDGNISILNIQSGGTNADTAYVRFCCDYLGEDSIVTVNEPIS